MNNELSLLVQNFIESLKQINWFKPDGKPKKEWKIFYGDTWGEARRKAREATHGVMQKTAWDMIHDATWDATQAAARIGAWNAAWNAAKKMATECSKRHSKSVSWDTKTGRRRWLGVWSFSDGFIRGMTGAHDEAKAAVENVAYDTALYASMLVVSDLDFPHKTKYIQHARERMEVWEKGYALLCDVDGVLYVYAKR